MSQYGDEDYQQRWRRNRDDRPQPSNMGFDSNECPPNGGMPPPPTGGPPQQGGAVPPPPLGDRRPSAMKRSGSQSRVPYLRPEFPEEASYLGSKAPDLEAKNRRHHQQFRDGRDGYESEEGEMLRSAKPSSRAQGALRGGGYDDDRRRPRGDPYDDRGPPRRNPYGDDEPPRRRRDDRDRDRDRDYDDEPPRRSKRRDQPSGVEYGSEPIQAMRRRNSEKQPRRAKGRKDDYDSSSSSDDDRRRRKDKDDRRRRRDYDDDKSDYDDRRRRDDRDRDRKSDKYRSRRYDDDDSDYDDRRSRRDRRDRDDDQYRRRRSSAPPREIKIGDYDIGPMLEKGKKSWGTLAPVATPLLMGLAKKYMSNSKR